MNLLFQQPVARQAWYAYVQDLIKSVIKMGANAGIRFDHYRYKPTTSALKYDLTSQKVEVYPRNNLVRSIFRWD